ncbi:MAG: AMP-dependent synthetase [Alphaproteobacteria bacterium]|nr:MAG: AMP-dependent synthetase [Alphaproteobacteria bacterium]
MAQSYTRGPDEPPVRDLTIGQALREAAQECPDRLAVIAGTPDPANRRTWTYAQLLEEAQAIAQAILARFEPGDRIAVWAPNIPEWITLEYASALAGTILVTVNPSYQPSEVEYVLNQSKSAGIFVMREFRGNRMLDHLNSVKDDCPRLKHVILFDDWEALLEEGRASNAALPEVAPMDATMIQYTSGTTGFPKGALLHHRGLVNNGAHTLNRLGLTGGETWVSMMPLFHTAGCVLGVLGALSVRATQVLVEQFDPGLVLELIETYKSDALLGVPTMLIAIKEHPDFQNRDISSLQFAMSGGSTVPAPLVRELEDKLGVSFAIVFGQTETSPVSSMTRPDDNIDDKAHTLGPAMPHVEIKIIDPETGETVPLGEKGEYCARGYSVMHEYYDNPEATAKTIDEEGWLHTGDLCSMDARGYTKIEGRLKDMIIRGGENIYPREIEELLFKHDTVGDVAVVGLPDDKFGEVVGAFLRPAPGKTLNREELFAYLRQHLSPQKTPKHWFEVADFPLTGSGKIQKFVLRDQWVEGKFSEMPT